MDHLQDQNFRAALRLLKAEFRPMRTYLFGSRAKSTAHSQSDYDLLMVIDSTSLTRLERMQRAQTLLWDERLPISIDAFIYTEDEFDKSISDFHSIPEIVIAEGVELDLEAI